MTAAGRIRWWVVIVLFGIAATFIVTSPLLLDWILLTTTIDHYPDGAVWRVYQTRRFGSDKGQAHGLWRAYHPDGSLSLEGRRVNGKWHGSVTSYDTHGRPLYEVQYEDGTVLLRRKLR